MRDQPWRLHMLVAWMTRGRAALKQELAAASEIDVTVLPYNEQVIDLIVEERRRGRKVVLATASHHGPAGRIAAHLGLFDEVIATEGNRNLSGGTKRDVLVERFGSRGFDYAGNSRADLPVWGAARRAHLVAAPPGVERKVRSMGNLAGVIRVPRTKVRDWAKALRLHQWLKNLLIFVPLFAAHRQTELPLLRRSIVAFVAFGLCASSVYVLNDLLDLRDDRHHATKKSRPFASGRLSNQSGLVASGALLLSAFGVATWQLPPEFTIGLGCYYALTLAYSLWLKRRMIIDVIVLAALYTLRVLVGAVALGIPLSFWLLAFSMFMFFSLAMVKRYAELFQVRAHGSERQVRGRGYVPDDLAMIASLGGACGYMAVMVLALYINDAHTTGLYRHPQVIWLACPLLLTWISRMWMLAHRGAVDEDPVIFAVRDRVSLCIGALMAMVFWAAT